MINKGNYRFWNDTNEHIINELSVRDIVYKYLKTKFPNSRIIGQYFEFNNIDLYVLEEKLPVEIQATPHGLSIAGFEKSCRQQIEENIKTLKKCWFFFDEDFLRYIQNDFTRKRCIQLDWMYKFMKEEKLKVFTLDYKGNIISKSLIDFNFILNMSVTCEKGKFLDDRILEKNKYDVLTRVLSYHKITQYDIDKLGYDYHINREKGQSFSVYLRSKSDEKGKLVERLFNTFSRLHQVNDTFEGNVIENYYSYCVWLGIFESEGYTRKNMIRFVDNSNIAQYFPAYLRNKEKWDKIKGKWLFPKQIEDIINHSSHSLSEY